MRIPDITRYAPQPGSDLCRHCGQPYANHDGQGSGLAVTCRVPTAEQMLHAFEALTQEGCSRFGTAWLGTNTDVVRLARTYRLEPGVDPRLRAVLVTLTMEICELREQASAARRRDAARLETYLRDKIAALETLRRHYDAGTTSYAYADGQLEAYRRVAAFVYDWDMGQASHDTQPPQHHPVCPDS